MEKTREETAGTEIQRVSRLEKILNDMKMNYKKIDFPDDDLVYVVNFNIDLSSDKNREVIVFLLDYANNKDLIIMCPNIYKLKKDDTTLGILVALNKVNSKLSGGTVTLEDDMVVYRRVVHFDRIDSINKLNLVKIFNDIIASIIYTAEEIKNIGR